MIIQLNDDYRIATDPNNWMLQQRRFKTDKAKERAGEEYWHVLGYYSSSEQLARSIPDHLAAMPEIETLGQLVAAVERFCGAQILKAAARQ